MHFRQNIADSFGVKINFQKATLFLIKSFAFEEQSYDSIYELSKVDLLK